MANLETLEITINANAQSASQGLASLSNSLSSLSDKIQIAYNNLSALNSEIRRLTGLANIKLPDLSKLTGAGKAVAAAKQNVMPTTDAFGKALNTNLPAYNAAGRLMEFAKAEDTVRTTTDEVRESGEKATSAFKNFRNAVSTTRKYISEAVPKVGLLNKVLRIASTMLIRMGLRAAFKGLKEGFDNYYQYAKQTGNAFASQMDTVSSTMSQLKNQGGAVLASALSAVLPVLNSIASAAITAFNALSQLFALLTGKSSWSKAKTQATEYAKAADKAGKGGGGGLKEQLAAFDELNVIAQESGGGGAAAAQDAALAYEDMFEEVYEFDEKIRAIADFLKPLIQWVVDNFDKILITVGAIKLAIAAWKISSALEGFLSKLAGFVAGGLLITLGVVLSYDFGKKWGKGDVDWTDVLEGIAGVVAAGIGGAIIGYKLGGPWGALAGAIIGVTIAVVATIVGYIEGKLEALKESRWGNKTMTPEQLQKFVDDMYSFDIVMETKILQNDVEGIQQAKEALNKAVLELQGSIRRVEIGIEEPMVLAEKVKSAVDAAIDYYNEFDELKTAYITIFPQSGIDESVDGSTGRQLIEQAGTEIAKIMETAVNGQLTADKAKMTADIARWVNDVVGGVDEYKNLLEYYDITEKGLSGYTRQTAKDVLAEQKKRDQEYYDAAVDAAYELADAYDLIAFQNKKIIDKGTNALGEELSAKEIEDLTNEMNKAKEQSRYLRETAGTEATRKVNEAKEATRDLWIKSLQNAFGVGEDSNAENILMYFLSSMKDGIFADELLIDVTDYIGLTAWDIFADNAKAQLVAALVVSGENAAEILKNSFSLDASEIIRITNWDLFQGNERKQFVGQMLEIFGGEETVNAIFAKDSWDNIGEKARKEILDQMLDVYTSKELLNIAKKAGIDIADSLTEANLDRLKRDFEKNIGDVGDKVQTYIDENWIWIAPIVETRGTDFSLDLIKEAMLRFGDECGLIVQNWDWIAPSVDDTNYKAQLYAMEKMMKATGIDLKDLLENWNLIAPMIDDGSYLDALAYIEKVAKGTGLTTKDILENWNLIAPLIDKNNIDTSVKNIQTAITLGGNDWKTTLQNMQLKAPSIDGSSCLASAQALRMNLENALGQKIMIPVGVKADGSAVETVTNKVTGGTKVSIVDKTPHAIYASGAYGISRGDVFIANEAGAELVGSINGKTSVANQGQIVEGIARGVESANAQQNALLREQNNILRGLLEKDATVRIGASAALGRVARQSIDMYGAMVGGV